ncbi:hypothetical protein JW752_04585 [Candidatus Peregrinibacteria bacterium]|nr:hypothetical protein [Candidatus Peregrinibacteria bacterium]
MPTIDQQAGEPVPTDKKYVDIVRSDIEIDKKYVDETGLPTKILYYCLDCKRLVAPKRIGKKFQFSCTECKGKNVAFGSASSLANYYKIPEAELKNKK